MVPRSHQARIHAVVASGTARTRGNSFPIGRNAAVRDGTGAIRGRVADAAVLVNYGQRKKIGGVNQVYAWDPNLTDGTHGSGWVRETALHHAPVPMPTRSLPNPGGISADTFPVGATFKRSRSVLNDCDCLAH